MLARVGEHHGARAVVFAVAVFQQRDCRMRTRRRRPVLIACSAFAGVRFPSGMIVLVVRWYLGFGLSYHDVEALLAECGIQADHVTVYRWVFHFTPLLADARRVQIFEPGS
jgi:hypothetical protein